MSCLSIDHFCDLITLSKHRLTFAEALCGMESPTDVRSPPITSIPITVPNRKLFGDVHSAKQGLCSVNTRLHPSPPLPRRGRRRRAAAHGDLKRRKDTGTIREYPDGDADAGRGVAERHASSKDTPRNPSPPFPATTHTALQLQQLAVRGSVVIAEGCCC